MKLSLINNYIFHRKQNEIISYQSRDICEIVVLLKRNKNVNGHDNSQNTALWNFWFSAFDLLFFKEKVYYFWEGSTQILPRNLWKTVFSIQNSSVKLFEIFKTEQILFVDRYEVIHLWRPRFRGRGVWDLWQPIQRKKFFL